MKRFLEEIVRSLMTEEEWKADAECVRQVELQIEKEEAEKKGQVN